MPTTYAIPDGRTVMAATIWTGNGSTQTINNAVNGVSFQPDMVWVKDRSAARSHVLIDAVRGTGLTLFPNETTADQSNTDRITSFNSNGFSVGAGLGTNANTETYVGWQWNAGGSTVTNTSGSISAQVRANATAGFSVVTWTAGGAGTTIGHGLGVAPNMIIVKDRSVVADWCVYTTTTGAGAFLKLNATAASAADTTMWGNTTPTSTTFKWGYSTGDSMVAYCFAAVAGYSAFGSYTGNGSTDGPFVYLGFRPRWIMFKRTDVAEGWQILDTARNTVNVVNSFLEANQSNAEGTSTARDTDYTANGFKVRNTSAAMNASGGTYIYAAFGENPLKYANAR